MKQLLIILFFFIVGCKQKANEPPPENRDRITRGREFVKDTMINRWHYDDFIPAVFSVTECNSCGLKKIPGYTRIRHEIRELFHIYVDTAGNRGLFVVLNYPKDDRAVKEYYDRNKILFNKNIIIWKEN